MENGFRVSDIGVNAPGPAEVSGILCVPENAARASLPAIVSFHGASFRSAEADFLPGAIRLDVNAQGLENRRERPYYQEKEKEINREGNYLLKDFV